MSNPSYQTFQVNRDPRGVITVLFDLPGKAQNIFEAQLMTELDRFLDTMHAETSSADAKVKVIVFRSNKPGGFFAGADIREIFKLKSFEEARDKSEVGQKLFQKVEDLAVPTIAVVHGACLGGGLEFALSCNYRIAVDQPNTKLGLPETQLGILPAWGGTQRLPKTVSLVIALDMILKGKLQSAAAAKQIQLVDMAVLPNELEPAVAKVVEIILQNPKLKLAGENKRTWTSWFMNNTSWGRSLVLKAVRKKIKSQIPNYPALAAAVSAIEVGITTTGNAGYLEEQTSLAELIPSPTCQNLIRIFFQRERAKSGADWKTDAEESPAKIKSIAVLGGGVMGAGIAQLAAKQGLNVVLKEINDEFADKAKVKIESTLDKLVRKKRLSPQAKTAMMNQFTFTSDWSPLASVDVAIEAVPEKMEIKNSVFQELEKVISTNALLASNTSALSIDEMQNALKQPSRLGGLHFFNPVHQMQLVEVVRAAQTSPQVVSQLVQITKQLGKVPIVTKNSPGFLVNRILMPYLDEGVRLVCEGYDIEQIDLQMRSFGMPMGPIELLDQVGLDVGLHVAGSMKKIFGKESPTEPILSKMVARGELGKKSGSGFYQYTGDIGVVSENWKIDQPTSLVPQQNAPSSQLVLNDQFTPIQTRLILAMINESVRCLDEQVVPQPWMIDLAMVLGTGFAPYRGGPLRVADAVGLKQIVNILETLKQAEGDRFTPAAGLLTRITTNDSFFHDGIGFAV